MEKSHVSFIMCGWFTNFAIWGFFSIIRKQPFTSGCWGCRCLIKWYQMCPQYTPLYIIFARLYFTLYLTNLFLYHSKVLLPLLPLLHLTRLFARRRRHCTGRHAMLNQVPDHPLNPQSYGQRLQKRMNHLMELFLQITCHQKWRATYEHCMYVCAYIYIYVCVYVCMLCPRWRIIPPTTPGIYIADFLHGNCRESNIKKTLSLSWCASIYIYIVYIRVRVHRVGVTSGGFHPHHFPGKELLFFTVNRVNWNHPGCQGLGSEYLPSGKHTKNYWKWP